MLLTPSAGLPAIQSQRKPLRASEAVVMASSSEFSTCAMPDRIALYTEADFQTCSSSATRTLKCQD